MQSAQSGSSILQSLVSTYRKAPITISLFASYFTSQFVSRAWLDYCIFTSLSGGPLPKNIFGWAVHYFVLSPLSLHSSWTSDRKLVRRYLPSSASDRFREEVETEELTTGVRLPSRQGRPPICAGTIPHRQLNSFHADVEAEVEQLRAIEQAHKAISSVLSSFQSHAENQPSHLRLGASQIESHSTALFAISHTLVSNTQGVSRSTRSAVFPSALSRRFLSGVSGEFAHVHCTTSSIESEDLGDKVVDGSLHLTLHPADAALVVEQGWGELHSLAGFPSYSGFWIGWPAWLQSLWPTKTGSARWWSASSVPCDGAVKASKAKGLPPTYCLVYSPRDMDEAQVVKDIVAASMAFAIGSRS